jgi:DtxR family transcriptional regulator, Mn-dependent transcriptional regulator
LEQTSYTEENYLKAIFKLFEKTEKPISTNAIAAEMETSAASVSDMLKRLNDKQLIHYVKYRGVTLTATGNEIATYLIRRHRLWEVFLVEKLDFSWDEIHEIAEELEHINSTKLTNRLEAFLGFPKFDPHGDPIPDEHGNFTTRTQILLSDAPLKKGIIVGVNEHSTAFLQQLDRLRLVLGTQVELLERFAYDDALIIRIEDGSELTISGKMAQNIYVKLQ